MKKFLDLFGADRLIAEIKKRLALKQDAEPGKGLSEENYTTEDKEKLESIDLSEYVKNTDYAEENKYGIVKVNIDYGTRIINNTLTIEGASENLVRNGTSTRRPLLPTSISVFMDEYGIYSKTTIPEMQEQIESFVHPKSFELIEEITINENGISKIKRTEEPDGTAYDFEKVFMEIFLPKNSISETNLILKVFTNFSFGAAVAYWSFSSDKEYASMLMEIKNGMCFSIARAPGANKYTSGQISAYSSGFGVKAEKTSTIEIISESEMFPMNTTIKIFAVRR